MNIDRLSYVFAFALGVGSLAVYFASALWFSRRERQESDPELDFNLGLPDSKTPHKLFAATLVAAGTSLSTVLVFFLTATPAYGWWLLLCPVMFAIGNYLVYRLYLAIRHNGYFTEDRSGMSGASGLMPFLGYRLTASRGIGWALLAISVTNLLAVLVLELVIGVQVIGYLTHHALGIPLSSLAEFVIFAVSTVLLLGYVFVGGFRASVASDVWQLAAMRWALLLTCASLAVFLFFSPRGASTFRDIPALPPVSTLFFFVLNVVLANLFAPMSQEASWQRFRAFGNRTQFDPRRATISAVVQALALWVILIAASFMLFLATAGPARGSLVSIEGVLSTIRGLNDWWFPLLVFPVLTVAALAAMYSTADTCVSAVLYLVQYGRGGADARSESSSPSLPGKYYLAMIGILVLALSTYLFVRVAFNPTVFQLVFSVFSNLVVIAPCVLLAAKFKPASTPKERQLRTRYVGGSLVIGFISYWSTALLAMRGGASYLWLSQLAIAFGLVGAGVPAVMYWLKHRSAAN